MPEAPPPLVELAKLLAQAVARRAEYEETKGKDNAHSSLRAVQQRPTKSEIDRGPTQ